MNIVHTESGMNWGGQEYRTLLEHLYLNNNGHRSWLICHPKSKLFIKAIHLKAGNVIPLNLSNTWNIYTSLYILFFCLKNKIELIHSHSPKDSLICYLSYLCGIPLIRSRQITSPIKSHKSYQLRCSHIIATADAIKKILIKSGVNENKITVIGEGVDLKEFSPDVDCASLINEFNIKPTDQIIVNIGMIRSDKGQEYYLKSANEVIKYNHYAKFFLIGESINSNDSNKLELKLENMVNEFDIAEKFIITGYRDDINKFIKLADLAVIASISGEAQSRVVPQAFSMRKTVVSTSIGGLTELVKDKMNGLVVPPQDPLAMAAAISCLLTDNDKRLQFADHAYKLAINELSFDKMMNKTLDLYATLT